MNGHQDPNQTQQPYRDVEEDAVPPGTVPRPERTSMINVWKDEDEEESEQLHS